MVCGSGLLLPRPGAALRGIVVELRRRSGRWQSVDVRTLQPGGTVPAPLLADRDGRHRPGPVLDRKPAASFRYRRLDVADRGNRDRGNDHATDHRRHRQHVGKRIPELVNLLFPRPWSHDRFRHDLVHHRLPGPLLRPAPY